MVEILEEQVKKTFAELSGSGYFTAVIGNDGHIFDYLVSVRMLTEALIENALKQQAEQLKIQHQGFDRIAGCSSNSSIGNSSSDYKHDLSISVFEKEMSILKKMLEEYFVKGERKDFYPEIISEDLTNSLLQRISSQANVDLRTVGLILRSECKKLTRSSFPASKRMHIENINKLKDYLKEQIKEQRLKCMMAQFNVKVTTFECNLSSRTLSICPSDTGSVVGNTPRHMPPNNDEAVCMEPASLFRPYSSSSSSIVPTFEAQRRSGRLDFGHDKDKEKQLLKLQEERKAKRKEIEQQKSILQQLKP